MHVLLTIAILVIFCIATHPLVQPYYRGLADFLTAFANIGSFIAALYVIHTSKETTILSQETYKNLQLATTMLEDAKQQAELLVLHDYGPRFSLKSLKTACLSSTNHQEVNLSGNIDVQCLGTKVLDIKNAGLKYQLADCSPLQEVLIGSKDSITPGFHCVWPFNLTVTTQLVPNQPLLMGAFIEYFNPVNQSIERYEEPLTQVEQLGTILT